MGTGSNALGRVGQLGMFMDSKKMMVLLMLLLSWIVIVPIVSAVPSVSMAHGIKGFRTDLFSLVFSKQKKPWPQHHIQSKRIKTKSAGYSVNTPTQVVPLLQKMVASSSIENHSSLLDLNNPIPFSEKRYDSVPFWNDSPTVTHEPLVESTPNSVIKNNAIPWNPRNPPFLSKESNPPVGLPATPSWTKPANLELKRKPLQELALGNVNPGWRQFWFTPTGRTNNCAYASYATDLRLSGGYPDAVASTSKEGVEVQLFYQPEEGWFRNTRRTIGIHSPAVETWYGRPLKKVSSFDDIERELLDAGPGARAFIDAHVTYHNHRHAFNAVTVLDEFNQPEVVFLDGQRNRLIPKWIVKMTFSDPTMLRTDLVIPSQVIWTDIHQAHIKKDRMPSIPTLPSFPIPIPLILPF